MHEDQGDLKAGGKFRVDLTHEQWCIHYITHAGETKIKQTRLLMVKTSIHRSTISMVRL